MLPAGTHQSNHSLPCQKMARQNDWYWIHDGRQSCPDIGLIQVIATSSKIVFK